MKAAWLLLATLLGHGQAFAHQLDEYVQATLINVAKDHLRAELYLTPGLNVLPDVLHAIDTDGDGQFSAEEQRTYVRRVLQDLTFTLNGRALVIEVVAFDFPTPQELRDSRGEIHLELVAKFRTDEQLNATFRFENRHLTRIAAYQVNCLASRDPSIRLGKQQRDPSQSTYEIAVALAADDTKVVPAR